MTRYITFIRHGLTNQNQIKIIQGRNDNPLNNFGKMQATKCASFLKDHDYHFDYITSSPLKRANETALIIKNCNNYLCDVIKDYSFIERDFGSKENTPVSIENFKDIIDDSALGLEKSYDLSNRVYNGVMNIINNTEFTNILIVSHSHAIKGFLIKIDNTKKISDNLFNCSVTNVIFEDNTFKIVDYNISTNEE